jgi:hypothetical protein
MDVSYEAGEEMSSESCEAYFNSRGESGIVTIASNFMYGPLSSVGNAYGRYEKYSQMFGLNTWRVEKTWEI